MGKLRNRILLTFLISSTFLIVITGLYNILNLINLSKTETQTMKEILYDDYDKMIKSEVETAISVVNIYYKLYNEGKLSLDAAKEEAKRFINELRYDGEGYFWIDDTNGILIVHPINTDQEGMNRIDLQDPNGVLIIKEIINVALDEPNNGYTNYMWEKPQDANTGKLSPKRAYSQLFAPWNWIISTGNYVDSIDTVVHEKQHFLNNNLKNNIVAIIIFIAASFILISIVAILLSKKISAPIIKLVKAFEKDENGQISIQEIHIKSKDEIGLLAATLNEMSLQIKTFIHGVVEESKHVTNSSEVVDSEVMSLNIRVNEIASATESITSGMEITAASCEEMNATASEIVNSVESIANKAQEAAVSVREISERADIIRVNFETNIQNGNSIFTNAKENLSQALEESKSVEQINELADAILQITNQTNLLALNASIEAARAGESGKGFAVVADEIRSLAEDSKETANKIQSVIKTVINSVNNLSENSTELLKFIEKNVKVDYGTMLQASDDYNKDAKKVEILVNDFHKTTDELYMSIQNMMKAIDEITVSTSDGSDHISGINDSIGNVNDKFNVLLEQAKESMEYSENLLNLVSRFKF